MPRDVLSLSSFSAATASLAPVPVSPGFLRLVCKLNEHQQLWLCCYLSLLVNGEHTIALIEQARMPQLVCPHCQHDRFHRYGTCRQLQRFRCLACHKTFNALTGTPLARLRHKNLWLPYCACLLDPDCTVMSAAGKTGIHRNTSFRWRHRFLDWIKHDRVRCLQGLVEVDDMHLRESQKGSRHLTRPARARGCRATNRRVPKDHVAIVIARDRAGNTIDFVAGSGRLSADALSKSLLPKIARDVMLIADSNPAYKEFARHHGISHRFFHRRQTVKTAGAIHMHDVDAYYGRFVQWLRHFNGVASSYLCNYLGWRWAIDLQRLHRPEDILRAALGAFNNER